MHPRSPFSSLSLLLRRRDGLRRALLVMSLLGISLASWAQGTDPTYGLPLTLSEKASVSFLASEPHAEEAYTLYGHAGLRVQDPQQGFDVTFNYGLFDFSEDFLWRFIQGKTDYIVAPQATSDYLATYLQFGAVHEAHLRTDSLQRAQIWAELLRTIQPESRIYRYDAFRNNCATRPLDLYLSTLRKASAGEQRRDTLVLVSRDAAIDYVLTPKTWREVINRLEASSPWLVLGTDLAMGTQLDAPIQLRERLFIPTDATTLLPHLRYGWADEAPELWISPVTTTEIYGRSQPMEAQGLWITHPLTIFSLLLLLTALWGALRLRRPSLPYIMESLLFVSASLAGALLFFLVFFSAHPMITTNWNLLVLHPFYLLFPLLSLGGRRTASLRRGLHGLSMLTLLAFAPVAYLTGQQVNTSVYLIALMLFVLQLVQLRVLSSDLSTSHASHEV